MINKIYYKMKDTDIYKNVLDNIKSKNEVYVISTNTDILDLKPLLVPIINTKFVSILLFTEEQLGKDYMEQNNLNNLELVKLSKNEYLIFLNKLYFNGVNSVIFNGYLKDNLGSLLYTIPSILKYIGNEKNVIIDDKYIPLISELRRLLINKKNFLYVYDKSLSVSDVSLGIVRFYIHNAHERYINLFVDEKDAEEYCKKNKIKYRKEYPIACVENRLLYNSIVTARRNSDVKVIYIYIDGERYKISTIDFMKLILRIGFDSIDLSVNS